MEFSLPVANATVALKEVSPEISSPLLEETVILDPTGFTANYISTLERGASFPRCEKLITLLNALEVSADAIFCDVVDHSTKYKANKLSEELETLPLDAQKRIIQMVELMIEQEKNNGK